MRSAMTAVLLAGCLAATPWGIGECDAGLILKYDFTGQPGDQSSQAAAFVAGQAAASDLTRGSGLTASSGANSMNARGFTTAAAIDLNDYYSFTISPDAGQMLTLTTLRFAERRSGSGIRKLEVRTSRDGFTTAQGGVVEIPDDTGFRDQLITLGGLTNLTSGITLRIYGWQAESGAGTWRLANHSGTGGLTVDGWLTPVPEPSTLTIAACLVLGCGAIRGRRSRPRVVQRGGHDGRG